MTAAWPTDIDRARIELAQRAVAAAVKKLLVKHKNAQFVVATELMACAMLILTPGGNLKDARSAAINVGEQAVAKLKLAKAEPAGGRQ